MVNVVFIVLGLMSAGELTIAVEFALRLDKGKFKVHFLVPGKFAYVLLNYRLDYLSLDPEAGVEHNRKKIFDFFKMVEPHLVTLVDPYTMEDSSYWSGLKFAALKKSGIPVVGVDEFEYASTGYRIDYYGRYIIKFPPLIDECDFLVRNCPMNWPRESAKKVKYYSFLGRRMNMEPGVRSDIRKRLGIASDEKMIFFATSKWETINMHNIMALTAFLKWIPTMVEKYLEQLSGKTVLVHVGPKPMGKHLHQARCINLEHVPPTEFQHYLLSADLLVTFNIVSVTLSKAVFGQVPCLVFQNEKIINFGKLQNRLSQKPDWYQAMAQEMKIAYNFKASSFGWHHFLDPVLKDNDYLETFERVPLFKMDAVVDSLEKLLFDDRERARLQGKQWEYTERILQLPAPQQVIEEILEEIQH